jgi:hypothetical protein
MQLLDIYYKARIFPATFENYFFYKEARRGRYAQKIP